MLKDVGRSSTNKVNSMLNKLITNKLSLAILMLSLLWVTVDAFNRLSPRSVSVNKPQQLANIVALPLPQLSAQTLSQLVLMYQPYKSNTKQITNKTSGMSVTEQAKQQGLLKSLFIDNNKVELKAVIRNKAVKSNSNKQLTALLLITDIKSNKSRIEKFTNDDLVYGYKLLIKANTQVILTRKQKLNEQKVILTMYKREASKLESSH